MTPERLMQWAGVGSIVAAVLILASQFTGLFLLASELPLSEFIRTTPATLYNILKMSGFVLLLLGLIGLYARQAVAGGMLALTGFLVAFLGTMLVAGDWWFETFAVPWLAEVAPRALDMAPSGTLVVGGVTGFALFAAGWVLFGIASFYRARRTLHTGADLLTMQAGCQRGRANTRRSSALRVPMGQELEAAANRHAAPPDGTASAAGRC